MQLETENRATTCSREKVCCERNGVLFRWWCESRPKPRRPRNGSQGNNGATITSEGFCSPGCPLSRYLDQRSVYEVKCILRSVSVFKGMTGCAE